MFNNQTTQGIRGGTVCGGRGLQLDKLQVCAPISPATSSTADIGHMQWTYLPGTPVCTLDAWQRVTIYPAECPDPWSFFACLFYIAFLGYWMILLLDL